MGGHHTKAAEQGKTSLRGLSVKNSTGVSELSIHQGWNSAAAGISVSELERILKQRTFTRYETYRLIAVLHSRTIQESPSPLLRVDASTSGSLKKHKHGDERDNFHSDIVSSRVLEEQIASPAELAKVYTIGTDQEPRQDLKLINNISGLPEMPMASRQHPASMESLPDELLINILMRLLAKELAQMRSVSKSWNTLLSQSSFIKSHLHHSIHNNDQVLLLFYYDESYYEDSSVDFKPFTAHLCQPPHLELSNFIKLPINPQPEYNKIEVIGSVNGLICSSYGDSVIQIWNPSLSTVLTLPPYAMPSHSYDSIVVYLRFGFDPKNDDYKVVKLTGLIGPSTSAVKWWLQVEVYSMRKGSWELITSGVPSHITKVIDGDYICVDGHDGRFHWFGVIGDMDSKTIVAFDLGLETFYEIPFPVSIVDPNVNACLDVLGVLGGKLCVMSWVDNEGYEVWVMDEYGVAESWVKCHAFSQFKDYSVSFGFTLRNEFVFEGGDCQLVLYDPITDKAKTLDCSYVIHKVVQYVDSLVWVTAAERA